MKITFMFAIRVNSYSERPPVDDDEVDEDDEDDDAAAARVASTLTARDAAQGNLDHESTSAHWLI